MGVPATSGSLRPSGLALKRNGALLVADAVKNRVRLIDKRTQIIGRFAGSTRGFSGDGGPANQAETNNPCAIALDSEESVYIAEFVNNRIRRVDART